MKLVAVQRQLAALLKAVSATDTCVTPLRHTYHHACEDPPNCSPPCALQMNRVTTSREELQLAGSWEHAEQTPCHRRGQTATCLSGRVSAGGRGGGRAESQQMWGQKGLPHPCPSDSTGRQADRQRQRDRKTQR